MYDDPIHYVVCTRKDNLWDPDRITAYLALLDKIEATEGPGIMVTIGNGERHFCTGFDLTKWATNKLIMDECI